MVKLSGKVIYIDPGHGRNRHGNLDPGAVGYLNGLEHHEATTALLISQRLKSELEKLGAIVYIGATIYKPGKDSDALNLFDRGPQINRLSPDIVVSIHHNSASNTTATGAEVLI